MSVYRFTTGFPPAQFQSNFPGISAASNATIALVEYRIAKEFAEKYGVWNGAIQSGLKPDAPKAQELLR